MNRRNRRRLRLIILVLLIVAGAALILLMLEGSSNREYEFVQLEPFFNQPTLVTHAEDDRLFVLERPGTIRILAGNTLLDAPFLDITDQVEDTKSPEQGLLGLAFEAGTERFYTHYTANDGAVTLSRWQTDPTNPDQALADSEEVLLSIPKSAANHNAGQLVFGPDGYLYMGVGDDNTPDTAADLQTLTGSILRLDVRPETGYEIPPDNPFIGQDDARPEIWLYGLRNPYRFAFTPTGDQVLIGDVGQADWEEINAVRTTAGGLFMGWPLFEGTHPYQASVALTNGGTLSADDIDVTMPIHEYSHAGFENTRYHRCAVTGGVIYQGDVLPALRGQYFFADWCDGTIWTLPDIDGTTEPETFMGTALNPTSFTVTPDGHLYMSSFSGYIYRLQEKNTS